AVLRGRAGELRRITACRSFIARGNNYRAVATADGTDPDSIAGMQQDDPNADVYYLGIFSKLTTNPIPKANAKIVASPLLTVWRHLTVERDHMRGPPAGEVFEQNEPRKDVDPGGDLPDLDFSLAQGFFRSGYGELRDAGALNQQNDIFWKHSFPTVASLNAVAPQALAGSRDLPNREDYWSAQLVSMYEPHEQANHDPPPGAPEIPIDGQLFDVSPEFALLGLTNKFYGASLVFTEVVRDVVAAAGPKRWPWDPSNQTWSEQDLGYEVRFDIADYLQRETYFQLLRQFKVPFASPGGPPGAGNQGIMNPTWYYVGNSPQIQLTPAQLAYVRYAFRPLD
ncbi:MAG: hypothetical protein K2P78_15210, partial [Gemmataceae bacterium]|nr:hypothetical protein [Gemmataceae bacterium]